MKHSLNFNELMKKTTTVSFDVVRQQPDQPHFLWMVFLCNTALHWIAYVCFDSNNADYIRITYTLYGSPPYDMYWILFFWLLK